MKTKLTPEQSKRLIELGIDPSKASDFEEIDVTDPNDPNQFLEMEYYRIFTHSDILSLLPKVIRHKGDPYNINIEWDDSWSASYFNTVNFVTPNKEGTIACEQAPELIDALYKLLCWVLTRKKSNNPYRNENQTNPRAIPAPHRTWH